GGQHLTAAPLILHWNGARWNSIANSCSSYGNLYGITSIKATDVWAVGTGYSCHYDGKTWTSVAIPPSGFGIDILFDVSATAANNVWAAGESLFCTSENGCYAQPYVIRWDGAQWNLVPGAPGVILNGVLALSANDVYVVGTYSIGTSIDHWDGRSW